MQLNTISCIFLPKSKLNTVKPVLSGHSKRRSKIGCQDRLSLNCREHSAILSTFIKLTFIINIVVLSIFEWPLETGFAVTDNPILAV